MQAPVLEVVEGCDIWLANRATIARVSSQTVGVIGFIKVHSVELIAVDYYDNRSGFLVIYLKLELKGA
jgi:hypothetical protein